MVSKHLPDKILVNYQEKKISFTEKSANTTLTEWRKYLHR